MQYFKMNIGSAGNDGSGETDEPEKKNQVGIRTETSGMSVEEAVEISGVKIQ